MLHPCAVLSPTRDASWRRQAGAGRRHTVHVVDEYDDDYDDEDDDDEADDDDDEDDADEEDEEEEKDRDKGQQNIFRPLRLNVSKHQIIC